MKKYLLIILIFLSCSLDYFPMPHWEIPLNIKLYSITDKNEYNNIIIIKKWMKNNISDDYTDLQLYGIFDYWATPLEVWRKLKGDCEDRCSLFGWLVYQFLYIKPVFFLVYNKIKKEGHMTAYIKKYDYYYNISDKDRHRYINDNNELLILKKYSFEEFYKLVEYVY
jgi:hypothetical protein